MIEKNVSLKPFNTFGLDVSAKMLARVLNLQSLQEVLADTTLKNEPKFILGGGSNVLLTKDVNALVIKNEIAGIELIDEDEKTVLIRSGAGVIWHDLVMHCVNLGYGGIENLSLIPGRVGAAPMQNIGAYGVELKDVFDSLEALEVGTGTLRVFKSNECGFGYRESVFKRALKNQYIITSVTLKLQKQHRLNTSYGAIEEELEKMGVYEPTIKDVSDAVVSIRQSKLPDPKLLGNAGSFFKNPVVSKQQYEELKSKFSGIPGYSDGVGVKLPAGWLIEQCGWKGKVVGNTGSHKNQALVLVNYGNATGAEIFDLSSSILASVNNTFGVQLDREVNVY
ncbi:UDP-N-acetylmuramate dehydrogenase [Bacteroidota bacterium]